MFMQQLAQIYSQNMNRNDHRSGKKYKKIGEQSGIDKTYSS